MIKIRRSTPNDRPILAALYYSVRHDEFAWAKNEALNISDFDADTNGETVLVSEADQSITGFLSIWEKDKFIHHLYVSPSWRGTGTGTALIKAAEDIWGYPLSLKCMKANQPALSFYLANGWTIREEAQCEEGAYYLMLLDRRK